MDRSLKKYYKQRQRGGRNTLARIVDYVCLRLIFAAACYIWFRVNIPNTAAAFILTAIATGLFVIASHLWGQFRFDAFVKRENERLMRLIALERLTLLDRQAFDAWMARVSDGISGLEDAYKVGVQCIDPIQCNQVLRMYRFAKDQHAEKIAFFCTAPLSAKAQALCSRLEITYVGPDDLLSFCKADEQSPICTDADILARIRSEQAADATRRSRLQSHPFAKGRTLRYLVCGAILIGVSFFTRFALYYRLLGGVCLALSATTFWLHFNTNNRSAEQ